MKEVSRMGQYSVDRGDGEQRVEGTGVVVDITVFEQRTYGRGEELSACQRLPSERYMWLF